MFIKALDAEKDDLRVQPLLERVRESMELLDMLKAEQIEIAMIRTGALRQLLATGWTQRDLAKELGISHGRVGQLAAYGPGKLRSADEVVEYEKRRSQIDKEMGL